jgi:hypothetical protein
MTKMRGIPIYSGLGYAASKILAFCSSKFIADLSNTA